jgi:hypothetical protein
MRKDQLPFIARTVAIATLIAVLGAGIAVAVYIHSGEQDRAELQQQLNEQGSHTAFALQHSIDEIVLGTMIAPSPSRLG